MRRCLTLLASLCLAMPAAADSSVTLWYDPHNAAQKTLVASAKRCCYLLMRQQKLHFDLHTVEGGRDLPALAYRDPQGRVHLVKRYGNAQKAVETALGAPIETRLHLDSEPANATVTGNGATLGVTPCDVAVAPGPLHLSLSLPDWQTTERDLRPALGDQATLNVSLQPAPAQLTLESSGAEMEVTLDDKPLGRTPVTLTVPAGMHQLKASADNFLPVAGEVHAAGGQRTRVRLTPTLARLRVGWGGLFVGPSNPQSFFNFGFSVGLGIGYTGSTGPAEPYEQPVSQDDNELAVMARQMMTDRGVLLAAGDCALTLEVGAPQGDVLAVAHVHNAQGKELKTIYTEREMPFFSFDVAGAARKRAFDAVRDVTAQALDWIVGNVKPAGPGESPLEVITDGPLQ